jgi:thioredoxin
MATIEMNSENFQETIENNDIVFIDYWADWCGPCRAFKPVFEKASESNPEITFAKVDTEQQQELAAAFQIRSIPTLMVFREGIMLFNQAGALPEPVLSDLISQVKKLDMDEVRQKIAELEAQQKQESETN